jgi:hypothetical protein
VSLREALLLRWEMLCCWAEYHELGIVLGWSLAALFSGLLAGCALWMAAGDWLGLVPGHLP